MPETTRCGKLFFYKNHCPLEAYRPRGFSAQAMTWHSALIVRKIVGSKSLWRTKRLVTVDVRAVSVAGRGLFAVRRDNGSTPRRQTQDQSAIGRNARNPTAH
jgi:hypothetical protein